MDLPATDVEVKMEKFDEVTEAGPSFHCGLADTEIVHKIAQVFLPGLGSACVDNTIGGLFKSPASVAVEIRKEMVEYLTQRSETFVAESVILEDGGEAEISDHPYDIISDFVDDFASSKRNFFSRVSGWILSEMREDRIDDFVQEMEINGFWFMERREAIAQTLLKNVDFKNTFHCDMKFNSDEELQGHTLQCGFRTMNCTNEGCNARFCAAQLENHDFACPFKILPCEQKCPQYIMRREMDKHCITLCTMKLVNCPFFPVGCQATIPQCKIADHRLEDLDSHLLYVLQVVHKGVSVNDLKKRVEQLIEAAFPGQIAEARDVRSLTFVIRGLEKNLGPLEISSETPPDSPKETENEESATENEGLIESPSKKEHRESTTEKEGFVELASKKEELEKSPEKKEVDSSSSSDETNETPRGKKECIDSPSNKEELSTKNEPCENSPVKKEEYTDSPPKKVASNESSPKAEERDASSSEKEDSPTRKEDFPDSLLEKEEHTESPPKIEKSNESSPKKESDDLSSEKEDSPTRKEECPDSPPLKNEESTESPPEKVESNEPSPKSEERHESSSEKEDSPTRKEEFPDSLLEKAERTESPPRKEKSEESSPKLEKSDGLSSEKEDSPTRKDSPPKEEDSPPVFKETL